LLKNSGALLLIYLIISETAGLTENKVLDIREKRVSSFPTTFVSDIFSELRKTCAQKRVSEVSKFTRLTAFHLNSRVEKH
jgi:hypothetical protein